jgi:hypothetical protein
LPEIDPDERNNRNQKAQRLDVKEAKNMPDSQRHILWEPRGVVAGTQVIPHSFVRSKNPVALAELRVTAKVTPQMSVTI